jgi:hypothetical protein
VIADRDPQAKAVSYLSGSILVAIGVASLTLSILEAAQHAADVAAFEQLKELLLPLVLTFFFLPFLYAQRYVMVMDSMLRRLHLRVEMIGTYANTRTLRFCENAARACVRHRSLTSSTAAFPGLLGLSKTYNPYSERFVDVLHPSKDPSYGQLVFCWAASSH